MKEKIVVLSLVFNAILAGFILVSACSVNTNGDQGADADLSQYVTKSELSNYQVLNEQLENKLKIFGNNMDDNTRSGLIIDDNWSTLVTTGSGATFDQLLGLDRADSSIIQALLEISINGSGGYLQVREQNSAIMWPITGNYNGNTIQTVVPVHYNGDDVRIFYSSTHTGATIRVKYIRVAL